MTGSTLTARGLVRGNRQFLRLWVAQLVVAAVSGVGSLVIPIFLLDQATPLTLGYFLGAETLSTLAALPVGGALADKYPRTLLVRLGYLVLTGSSLLLVVGAGTTNVPFMIGAAVLSGFGWGLCLPSTRAKVADLVSPDRIEQAQSLISASLGILATIGPAIGGLLLITMSPASLLIGKAVGFVVAACVVPSARGEARLGTGQEKLSLRSMAAGAQAALKVPWVVAGSLQTTVQVLLAFAPVYVLLRFVSEPRYGNVGLGLILAISGVADLLGTIVAGRWKPARPGLWACIGFMSFAGVELCLAVNVPLPVFCAAIFIGTFGIAFHGVWWYAAINRRFEPELRGRINALDQLSAKLFEPVGMGLAIPIATAVGVSTVAMTGFAVFLIVPLLALLAPGLARYSDAPLTKTKAPVREETPVTGL
ncbi:MFS transporter [Streptomyces sp. NPDC094034]|uniref:MFS transporter n=1 Tax=Streptomyces sp. NPDC094034 TaxID=3155309 RepID=UPI003318E4BB